MAEIWILIFAAINFFEPLGDPFGLKIGMGEHRHDCCAAFKQIFDTLVVWLSLGLFVQDLRRKPEIRLKLQTKKGQKIKKSNICLIAA